MKNRRLVKRIAMVVTAVAVAVGSFAGVSNNAKAGSTNAVLKVESSPGDYAYPTDGNASITVEGYEIENGQIMVVERAVAPDYIQEGKFGVEVSLQCANGDFPANTDIEVAYEFTYNNHRYRGNGIQNFGVETPYVFLEGQIEDATSSDVDDDDADDDDDDADTEDDTDDDTNTDDDIDDTDDTDDDADTEDADTEDDDTDDDADTEDDDNSDDADAENDDTDNNDDADNDNDAGNDDADAGSSSGHKHHTHNWEWTAIVSATENQDGTYAMKCTRCKSLDRSTITVIPKETVTSTKNLQTVTNVKPGETIKLDTKGTAAFNQYFVAELAKHADSAVEADFEYHNAQWTMTAPAGFNWAGCLDENGWAGFMHVAQENAEVTVVQK